MTDKDWSALFALLSQLGEEGIHGAQEFRNRLKTLPEEETIYIEEALAQLSDIWLELEQA